MILWLASYPRSGNTLLRMIFRAVFERDTYSKHGDEMDIAADARVAAEVGHRLLGANWPDAYAAMRSSEDLHLVKTHDPPEDDGKAIYIVRDGRSACRSFFHYLEDFPAQQSQLDMVDVIAGFTPFGSWGDHLDRWDPQNRPNTLLVRYENLLVNPAAEIKKITDFTGLTPLHDWQNNFDKLHDLSPRFFRAGPGSDAETALDAETKAIFWAQHGDWMRRLNYPQPSDGEIDVTAAFRRWISDRGREHFNLRERVFIAEKPDPSETVGAGARGTNSATSRPAFCRPGDSSGTARPARRCPAICRRDTKGISHRAPGKNAEQRAAWIGCGRTEHAPADAAWLALPAAGLDDGIRQHTLLGGRHAR